LLKRTRYLRLAMDFSWFLWGGRPPGLPSDDARGALIWTPAGHYIDIAARQSLPTRVIVFDSAVNLCATVVASLAGGGTYRFVPAQEDVRSAAIWSALGQHMSSRHRVHASSDGRKQWKLLELSPSLWYGLQTCDPRVAARARKHAGPTS